MCQANADCDQSVPDILGTDNGIFFDTELCELLIPSIYNNTTEMKKNSSALSFCFCRQSNQINMLGLMPEMYSS